MYNLHTCKSTGYNGSQAAGLIHTRIFYCLGLSNDACFSDIKADVLHPFALLSIMIKVMHDVSSDLYNASEINQKSTFDNIQCTL